MNYIYNKLSTSYENMFSLNRTNIDSLDTGDIILFNGQHNILSTIIERLTCSKYSHCGMVLKNPANIDLDIEVGIYMIESGYDSVCDVTTNKKKFGVEIVNLKDCIEKYTGSVYYVKLDFIRTPQLYLDLKNAYNLVKKDIYDINPFDLIKTILNIDVGDNNRDNMFICSALVSYLLYSCNIILYVKWDLIEPKHFANLTNENNIIKYNELDNSNSKKKDKQNRFKNQCIIFKPHIKIGELIECK